VQLRVDFHSFHSVNLVIGSCQLTCVDFTSFTTGFTARCIAIVSRQSVRPSVTLMYRGRMCWASSKLITRIISLGSLHPGAATLTIYSPSRWWKQTWSTREVSDKLQCVGQVGQRKSMDSPGYKHDKHVANADGKVAV